jgi:hypothetical protein
MAIEDDAFVLGVGVVAVGLAAWYLASHATDIIKAAPGAVADAAAAGVVGIGKAVGIPETNETACQKALREGNKWDASFYCPAGTFIGSIFSSEPPPDELQVY